MRKEEKITGKCTPVFCSAYILSAMRVDAESVSKVPSTAPVSGQTAALMPATSQPGVVGGSQPLCDN